MLQGWKGTDRSMILNVLVRVAVNNMENLKAFRYFVLVELA